MTKRISVLVLAFLFYVPGMGAPADSVRHVAQNDTLTAQHRSFDKEQLAKFREDSRFLYGKPKQGVSWFERLTFFFLSLLSKFIGLFANTVLGRTIAYIAMISLLLYVILKLLNIDVKDLFYKSARSRINFKLAEENIHEVDFEKLIREAINDKQFRVAVRLIFLHSLKKLSDADLIKWMPGKTNDEYLKEIENHPARQRVQELRFYFDYAWYGHFEISGDTFRHIHKTFDDLNESLK